MKLQSKKQLVHFYGLVVLLAVPVLIFVWYGLNTGLLPEFWRVDNPTLPWSTDNLYFHYMRQTFSMVGMLEGDAVLGVQYVLPLLAGIAVLPFIQMRDSYLTFAYPRLRHARAYECGMLAKGVLYAGCVIYLGYLLLVLWARWMFLNTYIDYECINPGVPVDAAQHPYLYVLLLGAIRFLLFPMVMALLTVAISYMTKRPYIYLLIPVIYNLIGYSLFAQGTGEDRWPLPLFSPENFIWMKGPRYWGFGHETSYIWGIVCAALIIIVPSIVMIWYGMRRRRA